MVVTVVCAIGGMDMLVMGSVAVSIAIPLLVVSLMLLRMCVRIVHCWSVLPVPVLLSAVSVTKPITIS